MAKTVKTKKRCCRSTPRCKDCPVVWKRLTVAGLAERVGKRTWRLTRGKVPKPVMKVLRRW